MTISTKILHVSLGAVVFTIGTALFIQHSTIKRQGVEALRTQMRSTIVEAENVRTSISALGNAGAFNRAALLAEFREKGDLKNSTIYRTIPVVAAWEAIAEVAKQEGFVFSVPKKEARNPKNNPKADELVILDRLERGEDEYFAVNAKENVAIFARPIKLTADCLACHGDPARSPTKDGKDILGFRMENWREGEVHGAFVLRADLARVDQVVGRSMLTTTLWMVPVAGLIIAGTLFATRRAIIRPMQHSIAEISEASVQTSSAASEIAQSSQSLASGASESAASLEETSATVEELASMTSRNAAHATDARALAARSLKTAESGTVAMQEMSRAMSEIHASASNVAQIVKTIDEIAFQTNLLALNAAVEAARAGEAGAGFAVVAEEVRSLAQRSATAAKESASRIDDSMNKAQRGADTCGRVSISLNEIVTQARELDSLVADIAASSDEQKQGLEQLNQAAGQMDKVTQQNAAAAEESAASAQELHAQTEALGVAVGELKKMSGATGWRARTVAPSVLPVNPQPVKVQRPRAEKNRPPADKAKRLETPLAETVAVADDHFADLGPSGHNGRIPDRHAR